MLYMAGTTWRQTLCLIQPRLLLRVRTGMILALGGVESLTFPTRMISWMCLPICAGMEPVFMIHYGFLPVYLPLELQDRDTLTSNCTKRISVTMAQAAAFPAREQMQK